MSKERLSIADYPLAEKRRDIVRAEDSIKIVDQDSRRRVTEVTQEGATTTARIAGHATGRCRRLTSCSA